MRAWFLPVVYLIVLGRAGSGCATYEAGDGDGGQNLGPIIGRACQEGADCGAGFQCFLSAPGGYCLEGEPDECFSDADCPEDTRCAPREYSQRVGHCLRSCASASDCRSGYQCRVVWLFPGEEQSPRSSGPVCWVPCTPGLDYMCNDNPLISTNYGHCNSDGTCQCLSDHELNPQTGRCR